MSNNGGESIAAEVISAALGGAFSASALYPLEVLKTRMQAEDGGGSGNGGGEEEEEEDAEGEVVGGEENDDEDEEEQEGTLVTPPTSPTDSSKRQPPSSSSPSPTSMIGYSRKMYAEGGVSAFYTGIGTSAIQSATEKALYFFAYTALKNGYTSITGGDKIGTLPNLALGCAAEWAHLPVTLPIDCLTTKLQTDNPNNEHAFALISAMLSEKGIGGMYKGIQAYAVLCLKPSIQYTVFEQVKRIVLLGRRHDRGSSERRIDEDSLSAAEAFFLGMVARTIATVAVFPYLRAKVMLQSSASSDHRKKSISTMIGEMYSTGGLGSLFQGLGPELTRGVFSAALMLMAKEKISAIVRAMIVGDRRRIDRGGGEDVRSR